MIDGGFVPDGDEDEAVLKSWEEELSKEDCLDGSLCMGWGFTQVGRTVTINEAKNEVVWNRIDKPHHTRDQQGREKGSKKVNDRAKKLRQVLLERQSACDVVLNPKLLVSIRR